MKETCFFAMLLSFVTLQADACIVGVMGESVQLPCIYNGVNNLTSMPFSSEWRRDLEVLHTKDWMENQQGTQCMSHSVRTTVSSLAPNTGDFTMELRDVHLSDAHNYSFYLKLHGQEKMSLICTVCLTVAGHFSYPTLLREITENGKQTQLVCNTRGGFPAPNISWLINHTQRSPETTVTTYVNTLPQSELYNITSVLSANISPDTAVSCVIENYLLNETLTATNCGVKSNSADGRLSKFQWIFSTVLCVVVFLLVAASLGFQKKLDRDRKREHHRCGDDSSSEGTEMIVMDMKQWDYLPETVV